MSINKHIDHTNLKPTATGTDIVQLCNEAKKYNFRAVCVYPCWVYLANNQLKDSDIKIATVVGFPIGANCSRIKANEAATAISHGANEIDMVWNLGWFKENKYLAVMEEITKIVDLVQFDYEAIVKVIVETYYLNKDEIVKAHQIVKDSGAQYIKTSTGAVSGAQLEDIITWKRLGGLKIKASGGIKTYPLARIFVTAGADILGTSSGVEIVEEENSGTSWCGSKEIYTEKEK